MRKFTFCFMATFLWLLNTFAGPAVTYQFSGGRFGDNLVAYLHAKWISYYYQMPLQYNPFHYSSELKMHEKELRNYQVGTCAFLERISSFDQPAAGGNTLFICPYFPEVASEIKSGLFIHFTVDWKNTEFRKIVNEMISPRNKLTLTHPPEGVVSIAMHVREGGGFDHPDYHQWNPEKIPPISFYVDSLLTILKYLKDKPIHCHIFTDAQNPKAILETIKASVSSDIQITFSCRENDNFHNVNVLEDFFSLFNFDILVRPQSNFSIVASLINDYAIVCSPISFCKENEVIKIDLIETVVDEELLKKCLYRAH